MLVTNLVIDKYIKRVILSGMKIEIKDRLIARLKREWVKNGIALPKEKIPTQDIVDMVNNYFDSGMDEDFGHDS
jgi:hypothetical protein